MLNPRSPSKLRDTLFLKLGGWLEARATGAGVIVLGLIVCMLLGAGLIRLVIE